MKLKEYLNKKMQNKIQEFFNVSPDYIVSSMEGTDTSQSNKSKYVKTNMAQWCCTLQLLVIGIQKKFYMMWGKKIASTQ